MDITDEGERERRMYKSLVSELYKAYLEAGADVDTAGHTIAELEQLLHSRGLTLDALVEGLVDPMKWDDTQKIFELVCTPPKNPIAQAKKSDEVYKPMTSSEIIHALSEYHRPERLYALVPMKLVCEAWELGP